MSDVDGFSIMTSETHLFFFSYSVNVLGEWMNEWVNSLMDQLIDKFLD